MQKGIDGQYEISDSDVALRSALTDNEVKLFYQLQVDETGKATGAQCGMCAVATMGRRCCFR